MSFPEVPIDESLFEGNALMRQYWERSTENRSMNFVPDARHEDLGLPDDLAELKSLTAEGLAMHNRPLGLPKSVDEPIEDAEPVNPEDAIDAPVRPKGLNGWGIAAIVIGSLLVLYLLGFYFVYPRFSVGIRV
jgi:hypothetical protein